MSSIATPVPPDESRAAVITALGWTTISLAFVAVGLRISARFKPKALGFDDALLVIGLAFAIFGHVCNVLQVKAGFGRHAHYLTQAQLIELARWSFAAILQVCVGSVFTKLSICWFLLRLLSGTSHKPLRYAIYSNMTVLVIVVLVFAIAYLRSCRPLAAFWDPNIKGECTSKAVLTQYVKAVNIVNCFTDFFCAISPIFVLRNLQVPRNTKIAIMSVLLLGLLTASCSIGRAITANFDLEDPSWDFVNESLWSITEQNVAIFVASLPPCRRLYGLVKEKITSHRGSAGSSKREVLGLSRPSSRMTLETSPNAEFNAAQDAKLKFGDVFKRVDITVEQTPAQATALGDVPSYSYDAHVSSNLP